MRMHTDGMPLSLVERHSVLFLAAAVPPAAHVAGEGMGASLQWAHDLPRTHH
jgi:hypothetical protein